MTGLTARRTVSAVSTPSAAAPDALVPVRGRDPHERHRTATPLELLYDLTFAVAFGQAGGLFAHEIAQGSLAAGTRGYLIAAFAIVWAWTNFSWYASAFDPDDWLHRLLTMVQMVGVVILALGLSPLFHSLHDPHPDNAIMVAGYVVMRVAMVAQWIRVAVADPAHRPVATRFALTVMVVQVGWVVLLVARTSWAVFIGAAAVLMIVEVGIPMGLERRYGTPWHPHHIAERYSLLVIITLGEGVIGTVAALSSAVSEHGGWSGDAILVVVAGIVLTFGIWWSYFTVDFGRALTLRREASLGFSIGHMIMLTAVAATGAGLHVAGYVLAGEARIDAATAIGAVALPVALFYLGLFGVYTWFVPEADVRHIGLLAGTAAILTASVLLARAGFSTALCLGVLMLSTLPTVLGYEWFGHRHQRDQLDRLAERGASAG